MQHLRISALATAPAASGQRSRAASFPLRPKATGLPHPRAPAGQRPRRAPANRPSGPRRRQTPACGPSLRGGRARPTSSPQLLLLGRLLRSLPPSLLPPPQGGLLLFAAVGRPTPSPCGEPRRRRLTVLCVPRRACEWRRGGRGRQGKEGKGREAAGVRRCGSGPADRLLPASAEPARRVSAARLGPAGCLRGRAVACLSLSWCLSCRRRLARVSVLHDCLGCRTFALPPAAAVGDVKARIEAEAGFPAAEQRLWHGGREVRRRGGGRLSHRCGGGGPHPAAICAVAGSSGAWAAALRCGAPVGSEGVVWAGSSPS